MLNHIVIMGRLAKDPELRHTQSGVAVTSFRLAVDRDFKDKNTGEKTVLIIATVISLIGTIAESKKGYWIALFTISVLLYIVMNALGGAA